MPVILILATVILPLTAPSSQPTSVGVSELNPTSVLVHWEEVPCPQRNGEITAYIVNISNVQETLMKFRNVSSEQRNVTLLELDARTVYTIRVAAENAMGIGPFSDPVYRNRTDSTSKQHIVDKIIIMSGSMSTQELDLSYSHLCMDV